MGDGGCRPTELYKREAFLLGRTHDEVNNNPALACDIWEPLTLN